MEASLNFVEIYLNKNLVKDVRVYNSYIRYKFIDSESEVVISHLKNVRSEIIDDFILIIAENDL